MDNLMQVFVTQRTFLVLAVNEEDSAMQKAGLQVICRNFNRGVHPSVVVFWSSLTVVGLAVIGTIERR